MLTSIMHIELAETQIRKSLEKHNNRLRMRVEAAKLIVQNSEFFNTYKKKFCAWPRALRLNGTTV